MPWETPTGTIDGSTAPTLACAGPIYDEMIAVDRLVQFPVIDYTPPAGSNSIPFLWVPPATALVRVKSKTAPGPNRVNWETPTVSADTLPLLTFSRQIYAEWLVIDRLLQAGFVDYIHVAPNQLRLLWSPPAGAIIRASYDTIPNPRRIGWETPRGTILAGITPSLLSAAPIAGEEIYAVDRLVQIPGTDYAPDGTTDLGQTQPVPPTAVLALLYDTVADLGSDTSGALVHARDIEGDAAGHVLQQYRDATAPGVIEEVETNVSEVQVLEDALWSILDDTGIDSPTTVGANLDRLGKIVGQPRAGLSDSDYLLWLTARILVNRSSGSIDDILAIFMLINPGAAITFVEQFPAAFALKVNGIVVQAPAIQAAILKVARKAGVGGILEYSTAPTGSGFCFAGGSGKGFPDAILTPGSGGKLAGAAL